MEAIYDHAKKIKAFYSPGNLAAEISTTKEAQRRVISAIQQAEQETQEAVAELHLNDNGKNSNFYTYNFSELFEGALARRPPNTPTLPLLLHGTMVLQVSIC